MKEGKINLSPFFVLTPKKLVDKDQEWFWTKEWQERENEADKAIAKGEVTGPFVKDVS